MTSETPQATPEKQATSDKKDYQAPKGATQKLAWTNDRGESSDIEVISEWIVLRKKEKPAAEIFHTYYRLADAKGRRPISFVFNGGPGASSAYLHIGGLSPQRVFSSRTAICRRRRSGSSTTRRAGSASPIWSSSIRSEPVSADRRAREKAGRERKARSGENRRREGIFRAEPRSRIARRIHRAVPVQI